MGCCSSSPSVTASIPRQEKTSSKQRIQSENNWLADYKKDGPNHTAHSTVRSDKRGDKNDIDETLN